MQAEHFRDHGVFEHAIEVAGQTREAREQPIAIFMPSHQHQQVVALVQE